MEFDTRPLNTIIENQSLLESLAKEYGTPAYIYSADRIRDNVTRLVDAFDKYLDKYQLYYAIKANQNPALVKVMQQAHPEIGIDCSTRGEVNLAEKAGVNIERLVYTGNYESYRDLEYTLEKGLPVNFDDITSYKRCREIRIPELASFRVNPGSGKGMYPGITTAGKAVKFGVPIDQISEAYTLAIEDSVKRFGLHTMVGSGITDSDYIAWNANRVLEIAADLEKSLDITFEYIDLGGGFGIPYKEDESAVNLDQIFSRIRLSLDEYFRDRHIPKIAFELGRYIVGDAGFILARVLGTKENEQYFAGLDIGMNGLLRPALYDAYHRVIPIGETIHRDTRVTQLTGQICENTDRLAKDRLLPELRAGDLVAILDTGAYGFCLASQYNGLPRPSELLLDGDDHFIIRDQETLDDLSWHVHIPDFLT